MEDNVVLSMDEHKILKRNQTFLENLYKVQIIMPDVGNDSLFVNDFIVACILGNEQSISCVKNYLKEQTENLKKRRANRCVLVENVPIITLSDSDAEIPSESVLTDQQNKPRKRKKCKQSKRLPEQMINTTSVEKVVNSLIHQASKIQVLRPITVHEVDSPSTVQEDLSSTINLCDSICDVSSTTETSEPSTSTRSSCADVFIPLFVERSQERFKPQRGRESNKNCRFEERSENTGNDSTKADDSVIILDDNDIPVPEIPKPVPRDTTLLRQIVIDGNNVAREHGKMTKTYSCKGIQISVEYFLKRGHTQVTAFVPNFRRHRHFGPVPTTDHPLLEEMADKQYVTFTPSRKINGKCVNSYDDRFIVQLAAQTGGVIVSNDNYRDLMDESEAFKKAIEERLLKFCFVGDIFMVPNDPLGRHGPKLDDYLSFPPSVSAEACNLKT